MNSFPPHLTERPWFRWLFLTRNGAFIIGQTPNLPLIAAIVSGGLSLLLTGSLHHFAVGAWYVSSIVWAILELGWGVNRFRRILGAVVLLLLLVF